jgi:predicted RNase H-like nuclease
MPRTETAVGVDACPHGWFATVLTDDEIETKVYEDFSEVVEDHPETQILVDIPIGLPTGSRRDCDIEARDLLGCRGNSVFYPPCDAAAKLEDYDEANEKHREMMGHGLSQQAHAIRKKINEVGEAVGERYDGPIRESHPELCFYAFNGQPVANPKSSKLRGLPFRQHLLEQENRGFAEVYAQVLDDTLRKEVGRDDILDSMVLALAAQSEKLQSVPEEPGPNVPRIYYPATAALAHDPWDEP